MIIKTFGSEVERTLIFTIELFILTTGAVDCQFPTKFVDCADALNANKKNIATKLIPNMFNFIVFIISKFKCETQSKNSSELSN
jgi:hypothetical protein